MTAAEFVAGSALMALVIVSVWALSNDRTWENRYVALIDRKSEEESRLEDANATVAKLNAELKEYRVAVLIAELSDLSEQYWAASWQPGFERAVGLAVFDPSADRRVWQGIQLLETETDKLRGLADRLGGWIHEFEDGLNFIPMAQWRASVGLDAGGE